MENQQQKADNPAVGELILKLCQRKIIPVRFSLPMPAADVERALRVAYGLEVQARGRAAIPDEDTMQHIRAAAKWLADPSGKFGLMLQGLYGNGKSTLMAAICSLINAFGDSVTGSERKSISIIEAREIARLASGDDTRQQYERLIGQEMLAIDDLGEEPAEIMTYGMVYTPVKDLLLARYARQKFTIVSTNLINTENAPQLAEHYGARVVDRFREMMEIIVFKNSSYRRK